MVKRLLSMLAIASMLFATSCSNEELDSVKSGNEAVVSFTAQLPSGLQSRVAVEPGNGQTAKKLTCYVYKLDAAGNWTYLENLKKEATFTNLETNVDFRLVNGESYKIVFWADAFGNQNSPFSFDAENAKMTLNYANLASNREDLDAFYKVETINVALNTSIDKNVTLTRPFAQLNIGTADLTDVETNSEMNTVTTGITLECANVLNFKTEEVEGSESRTYTLAARPNKDAYTFPVTGYEYLALNYILMPTDKQMVDVKFNYNDGTDKSRTFNVPLQRNYRTNIYGNLLTTMGEYDVEINPVPLNTYSIEIVVPSNPDAEIVEISTPQHLAWVVNQVNTGADNFSGQTIKLSGDIDLAGTAWTPIGTSTSKFEGSFDGNNKSIKNISIDNGDNNNAGFFGYVQGKKVGKVTTNAEIKNLVLENVEVKGGWRIGGLIGNCGNYTVVNNITVKGLVKIEGYSDVGAVVGATCRTINNITISVDEGSYVKSAVGTVGGVAGLLVENYHAEDITSNINVIAVNVDGKGNNPGVGGIFGCANGYGSTITLCASSGNVTIQNATTEVLAQKIGGIAGGKQSGKLTLESCSYTGTLTSKYGEISITTFNNSSLVGGAQDSNVIIK